MQVCNKLILQRSCCQVIPLFRRSMFLLHNNNKAILTKTCIVHLHKIKSVSFQIKDIFQYWTILHFRINPSNRGFTVSTKHRFDKKPQDYAQSSQDQNHNHKILCKITKCSARDEMSKNSSASYSKFGLSKRELNFSVAARP